jgi:hypothetical protein
MPESGRDDYDRLIRFSQLEPGEPYFFIRGRDKVAGAAVRAWAAIASRAGAPPAIVESALQQADRLDRWPTKQLPDADHLSQAERLDLEHQLQRRAWNHRIAHAPNEAVVLAEARGAAAALSRDRHTDKLLADLVVCLGPVVAKSTADPESKTRALAALQRVAADLERRRAAVAATTPAAAAPAGMPETIEGEFAVSVFEAEPGPSSGELVEFPRG